MVLQIASVLGSVGGLFMIKELGVLFKLGQATAIDITANYTAIVASSTLVRQFALSMEQATGEGICRDIL